MAADLGLVVHTSKGDAHVLASQGFGDGLSKGGLAYSRRAVEAKDRAPHIALELEDCKVLYDPLLDFFKAVVVVVKDLLGVLEVQVVL